jgi:hypothetical protein
VLPLVDIGSIAVIIGGSIMVISDILGICKKVDPASLDWIGM